MSDTENGSHPIANGSEGVETIHEKPSLGRRVLIGAGALALAGAAVLGISNLDHNDGRELAPVANASADESTTTSPEHEVCAETWEMTGVDHGDNHRWFADGITEIKDAENDDQARDALDRWLNGTSDGAHPGVKHDPKLFAAGYNAMKQLFSDPNVPELTAEELKDEDGCATQTATDAVVRLQAELAVAEVTAGEAPANGVNTGTDVEGNVTIAEKGGVSGDRKAIVLTKVTADGIVCTIAIMGRCGQIVVEEHCVPKSIPKGTTDNDTPKTPETTIKKPTLKVDDGVLPGDGKAASQDKGTPDKPGTGTPQQKPAPNGTVSGETLPTQQQTTTTAERSTTTSNQTTASTSPQPTSTSAPAPATTSSPTTAPQSEPRPAKP